MSSIVTKLAARFLTGKKRNSFVSFISAVSLFGVSVGVAALVVVMSVMEGFETDLRGIITATHSHIIVYPTRGIIRNWQRIETKIKDKFPEVESVSPYIFSQVMLAKDGRVAGSLVNGIDLDSAAKTTQIKSQIRQGSLWEASQDSAAEMSSDSELATEEQRNSVVIGNIIAEKLNAKVDDTIYMISPSLSADNLQPKTKKFRVSGILSTGMYDYDSKNSFVRDSVARKFFSLPKSSVSALRVKSAKPKESFELSRKIKNHLGFPYTTTDWSELNKNLLYAVKLQKIVIFIVLVSIIVVAAFNIMSTLVMMMNEKRREVSILKAMGLQNRKAASIFALVGFIIGSAGAAFGAAFGILICQVLANTNFVQLPPDVYFISYLPVEVRPVTLALIIGCSLTVALLASIYPTLKIANESPIRGLRYE